MKKLKSLALFLLVFTFIVNLVPLTAFASPCCELGINSVTQSEDGMITVDYWAINPLPNREVKVTVSTISDTNTMQLYEDTFYIQNGVYDDESTVYTFDGSFLLEGETYEIDISYTYCCPNIYCSYVRDSKKITITSGIPTFDYKDILDGMLELIGESKAAVKLTASAKGIYDFDVYSYGNDYIEVKSYPNNHFVYPGPIMMNEGESRIFILSNEDGNDLNAEIIFEKATVNDIEPETQNPGHNDVCFELSGVHGIQKINVPKKGIYLFELEDEYDHSALELLDEDGERLNDIFAGRNTKEYLKTGTYLLNTKYLSDDYSLTVKYIVPDTLEFDKVYTPEFNEYNDIYSFYTVKITKPAIFCVDNEDMIGCRLYLDNYDEWLYEDDKIALCPGEYYLYINNSTGADAEISFAKDEFDSISLNTPYTPDANVENNQYFSAFHAPKSGKYEFDFTKYQGYHWFNKNDNGSNMSYEVIELNKDEWVLIGMYAPAEIKVVEYKEPVPVELKYEEPAYYDFITGKTFVYSFIPTDDGLYKLYTENTYASNIKVWVDDVVLYETDENNSYSIDKNFELKKNETVYVSFGGGGYTSEERSSVVFKSPYIELNGYNDVIVSSDADVNTYYVPQESGYYKFNFSRGYGSYDDVIVEINGKEYNVYNNYYKEVTLYLEKGEKLFVTFKKFTGNQLPSVSVSIAPLDVTEITTDTSYTPEYNKYYSFIPENDGVYMATFPSDYNFLISCDEGEYISLGENNEQIFVGKKGKTYLLYGREPYFVPDDEDGYTDFKITEVDSTTIGLNKTYTSTEDMQIYTFYTSESGLYRVNDERCNSMIFIYYDGQWSEVCGTYSSLFRLEKGLNCIVVQHEKFSENNPDANIEGIDTPYAKFSINKANDTNKLGISLVDAFIFPTGAPVLRFCLTSPADLLDLNYGIEFVDEYGETVQRVLGYESMYASDMRYVEQIPYFATWTLGDTVTFRPYVFTEENEDEIIYGEEKTVTFDLHKDITPLSHKSTKVDVKSFDDYRFYKKPYWYSFIQPETDSAQTYIRVSDIFDDFDLIDEDMNYISSFQDIDGNIYYELEAGKKYYILAEAMFNDSDAEIYVSSLPDASLNTEVLSNVNISGNAVSFVASTSRSCTAYIAAYDENGVLVELNTVENPNGAYNVTFSNKTIDSYKLMVIDTNNKPLCNAFEG